MIISRLRQLLIYAGAAAALMYLEEQKDKRGERPSARQRQRRTVQELYECAYINTHYNMATPYINQNHSGVRDNYNFYHSQLRIKIECAFGMLADRTVGDSAVPHAKKHPDP